MKFDEEAKCCEVKFNEEFDGLAILDLPSAASKKYLRRELTPYYSKQKPISEDSNELDCDEREGTPVVHSKDGRTDRGMRELPCPESPVDAKIVEPPNQRVSKPQKSLVKGFSNKENEGRRNKTEAKRKVTASSMLRRSQLPDELERIIDSLNNSQNGLKNNEGLKFSRNRKPGALARDPKPWEFEESGRKGSVNRSLVKQSSLNKLDFARIREAKSQRKNVGGHIQRVIPFARSGNEMVAHLHMDKEFKEKYGSRTAVTPLKLFTGRDSERVKQGN